MGEPVLPRAVRCALTFGLGHDLVRKLRARSRMGERKYGTVLQTHNGRDALRDVDEELCDAVMYATQAMMEGRVKTDDYEAAMNAIGRVRFVLGLEGVRHDGEQPAPAVTP